LTRIDEALAARHAARIEVQDLVVETAEAFGDASCGSAQALGYDCLAAFEKRASI